MTMSSLQAMNERMAQWMNEKPTFDGGNELKLNRDDLAIIQFVASGNDGDQFLKVYRSHLIEAISKKGKPYNTHRYCTVQSGDEEACVYCDNLPAEKKSIKERMSMWFFVTAIMHNKLPEGKQFPYVEYEGKKYYHEEVNDFMIWHTSAWRDSCWPDIVKLGSMYQGLHNFTAQLICAGEGLERRYKVFAIPNSAALSEEQYVKAKESCDNIGEMLKKQVNSPVALNPNAGEQQQAQPQQQAVPFQLGGQPSAQAVPFTIGQPAATDDGPKVVDPPPSTPEADQRRPLKSLF